MTTKVALSFTEIAHRMKMLLLPEVDLVVGIARGGVVPASLAAYQLDRPLQVMRVQYRDDDNQPMHDAPLLLSPPPLPAGHLRLLLVDDVSVSGRTIQAARLALAGHDIVTLVCKGRGDYVLFPEISECVLWPWNVE